MKTKIITAALVAGALLAPYAALAAPEGDSDRSSPGAFVADSMITAKIKAEFMKDPRVSAMHIRVDTDNKGVVQLSGKATSQEEIDKAVRIAQNIKGVEGVRNNIRLTSER